MKDANRKKLESSRPMGCALDLIDHCLSRFYRDKDHFTEEVIISGLTFEEVIGALLVARDELTPSNEYDDDEEYWEHSRGHDADEEDEDYDA